MTRLSIGFYAFFQGVKFNAIDGEPFQINSPFFGVECIVKNKSFPNFQLRKFILLENVSAILTEKLRGLLDYLLQET